MKCSPLLPQVALVFAVAYACTDSTAPANFHALLTPNDPVGVISGDPPPPPADATIGICAGTAGCDAFNGVYFSNGLTLESFVALAEVGEQHTPSTGMAWLKLDNKQPELSDFGTTSANARFKVQDGKPSGMGTLGINGHVVVITAVTDFFPTPFCEPGQACATIFFRFTVDGGEEQEGGSATAFNRDCTFDPPEEGSGSGSFDCGE